MCDECWQTREQSNSKPYGQPSLLFRPTNVTTQRMDAPILCFAKGRKSIYRPGDCGVVEAELPGCPLPGWSPVTRKHGYRQSVSITIDAGSPA